MILKNIGTPYEVIWRQNINDHNLNEGGGKPAFLFSDFFKNKLTLKKRKKNTKY
jgi:hypothetical protein